MESTNPRSSERPQILLNSLSTPLEDFRCSGFDALLNSVYFFYWRIILGTVRNGCFCGSVFFGHDLTCVLFGGGTCNAYQFIDLYVLPTSII